MKYEKKFLLIVILSIAMTLLASCKPDNSVDLSLAGTYAAQTLAAMPTDTPEPTLTPEPSATATDRPTPTLVPTLEPVGPVGFPENVNPLTGMVVEDPAILNRRPVIVKIANYPLSGRPHAGLSSADMVFEYFIGSGANRFAALYYGEDAHIIGPVRSGRMIDPYLTSMYEGILGFEGAYVLIWEHIVNILNNRAISGKDLCPGICDDGRNIVTSVFADSEALTKIATNRGVVNQKFTLEGMAFDNNAPEGGETAEVVNIRFSQLNPSEWRFDNESGKYLAWIDDEVGQGIDLIPMVDRVNEEQLAFSNLVVLFAEHDEIAPTWHDIFLWDNYSGKRAVVFRDGNAYDINWKSPSRTQPIQFVDDAGETFKLKHGNTWIVIMGLYSNVNRIDNNWTFDFYMP